MLIRANGLLARVPTIAALLATLIASCADEQAAGQVIVPAVDLTHVTYCDLSLSGNRELVEISLFEKLNNAPRGYITTGRSVVLELPAAALRTRGACRGGAQMMVGIGWPLDAEGLRGRYAPLPRQVPQPVSLWADRPKTEQVLIELTADTPRRLLPFSATDLANRSQLSIVGSHVRDTARPVGMTHCDFDMLETQHLDSEVLVAPSASARAKLRTLAVYPWNTADYFARRGERGGYEVIFVCRVLPGDSSVAGCTGEADVNGFIARVHFPGNRLCEGNQLMKDVREFLKGSVVRQTDRTSASN